MPYHTSAIKYFFRQIDQNGILIFGPTFGFHFFGRTKEGSKSVPQSLICSTALTNSEHLCRTMTETPPYDHWKKRTEVKQL